MEKMKLDVEELSVDTFSLGDRSAEAGTVHAAEATHDCTGLTRCEPHSCVSTFPC